ncbi:MAG: MtrB/PioB family decaheme-associated outer membrane protein, partial [Magnetospirillum sp.]|nr:MtrB/PioB family decaheme-associated outer membrane protein [Magnetospirillum sp.]
SAGGRFNRFTGATTGSPLATGAFHFQDRATEADQGTNFVVVDASNLDFTTSQALPDASAALRFGQQGIWDGTVWYDGIPYLQTDNFHTVLGSSGELLNGLAAKSISTTASAGVPVANSYLSVMDVGTRRDRVGGKVRYAGLEDWSFSSKMEHEHKQGTKANSFMFINNNTFAAFPEPENYNTDRFTTTAAYTTRPFQAQLSYTFSSFTNEQAEFQMASPFSGTTRADYVYSQYSLPPSNSEHQVKGQFGLNLTETSRVAMNLRYGLQLQNEIFTARYYEVAPGLSDSSYDGMIQNLYGNVAFTSRPLKDWNFRAAYTVDDRENSSQTYNLQTRRGDTGTGTWQIRQNAPYSFLNQSADFELGYRLIKSTKLTLNYNYQDRQRTYAVTSRNQENTVGGKVQSTLADGLTGTLGYSRAIRQATAYDGTRGWRELGRSAAQALPEKDLGLYTYAARNRDEVKANLNWGVGPAWSVGATARYVNDRFPNSYFGVTDNHMISAGPDVSFSPTKDVTTHFYYTYQENYTDLMANASASAGNPNGAVWNLKNKDSVHSVGLRTDWQVSDHFKLSAANNLSYGNTAFEETSWWQGAGTASAANTATSLPSNKSVTNSLKLSGEYELCENVFIGLSGLWERFLSVDYLNSQAAAATNNASTSTVLLPGEGNPSYSAGLVMASTRFVW